MGDGRHQPERFAQRAAGDAPMAFRVAQFGLRTHLDCRMMTDPDGNRAGLSLCPELPQIDHVVGRFEHVAAHQPRPPNPQSLNPHIVDAGIGIVGHHVAARDVVPGVTVVLTECWQYLQIGRVAFLHDLAHRGSRGIDGDRIDRLRGQTSHGFCRFSVIVDPHRLCRQFAAGEQVGQHWHVRNAAIGQFRLSDEDRRIGVLCCRDVLQCRDFLLDRHRRGRAEDRVIDFVQIGAKIGHSAAVDLSASETFSGST